MVQVDQTGSTPAAMLEIAVGAAKASITVLCKPSRGSYAGPGIGTRDIKIAEDKLSEEHIIAYLRERSQLPILSEESRWCFGKPSATEPYWVIDPLDGSFNYYRGIPLCCTSVALCVGLEPVLGAIYDFNRDEIFSGGPGLGLTLNGDFVNRPIAKTEILATGFPVRGDHGEKAATVIAAQTSDWKKIRMLGSAALSLAWVAAGKMDSYEECGIMLWDVAAGIALARASGRTATLSGTSAEDPLNVRVIP